MRKLLIFFAAAAAIAVSACNTIEGAGKDVKATGQAVQDTAQDAKPHV
jgi:predicted small secreted protein